MQKLFSGLKDKNGKKLCDGDWVEFEENSAACAISVGLNLDGNYVDKFVTKKSKIVFRDGCFVIQPPRISTMGPQDLLRDVIHYIEKI